MSYHDDLAAHYRDVRSRLNPTTPPPPDKPRITRSLSPFNPMRARQLSRTWFVPAPSPYDDGGICVVVRIPTLAKQIVRQVAQKHGVSVKDVYSVRRDRPSVAARHEAMYRLREETTLSLPQIGRLLGGRDHTTVLHGIRKHAAGRIESTVFANGEGWK